MRNQIILFLGVLAFLVASSPSYKIVSTQVAYNSETWLSNGENIFFQNRSGVYFDNLAANEVTLVVPSSVCPSGSDIYFNFENWGLQSCVGVEETSPNFEINVFNPLDNNELIRSVQMINASLEIYPISQYYALYSNYGYLQGEGNFSIYSVLSGKVVCEFSSCYIIILL